MIVDGRRLANVVGIALEGQAEGGQPLAAQSPQRRAHLVEEDIPLGFVDLANFLEQLKIHALLLRHPVESGHILRETGTAVPQPGAEKLGADAAVQADARGDVLDVRVHGLGQVGHRVDERDLHGQKGVGGMLDDLRALRRSDQQLGRAFAALQLPGKASGWA